MSGAATPTVHRHDAVIVGSGSAALSAALRLAPRRVAVLTKTGFGDGASRWAQGGIAAALGGDDSPALHAADTRAVAGGIPAPEAVEILTREGPARLSELLALGLRADRGPAGELSLGLEGGHRRRRVVHADGDATGAELMRLLVALARESARDPGGLEIFPKTFASWLLVDGGRVIGVLASDADGHPRIFVAPAVILATGGAGQLFARTTNPPEATGDGLAMAARAGAVLADLEFVQFHPTALDVEALETGASPDAGDGDGLAAGGHGDREGDAPPGERPAPRGGSVPTCGGREGDDGDIPPRGRPARVRALPLLTEALRGAGATLIDDRGERFLTAVDPRAELAPRDVVARAIWERQAAGRRVFLDCRDVLATDPDGFPTLVATCRRFGLDPARQPLPVSPAAHYFMGGVATDEAGRTSLPGLWACGEVASTGVHGANRLASNSLLEALVFGARVAHDVAGAEAPRVDEARAVELARPLIDGTHLAPRSGDDDEPIRRLRHLLWRHAGLVRTEHGLKAALREMDRLDEVKGMEAANLFLVGRLIATAALARRESRGAHFRRDFPKSDPAWARRQLARLEHDSWGEVVLAPAGEPHGAGGGEATTARVEGGPVR